MPLDLASFESVLEFSSSTKRRITFKCLDLQGGLIAPQKASAPNSKIINVSSSGHKRGDGVNLDNIQSQKSYSQGKAYGNSKLFQIMNTFSLHSKIKDTGIDVFSVHPGVVDTGFSKGYSGLYKAATLLHKGFGRTSDDGAATTLSAALDEQFHGKGPLYFSSCKPVQPSATARNEEQQKQLWIYSLGLLQEHLDDTLLADVGETLESIKPKEPEPEPEPKPAEEEGDKKEEEGAKEEEKGADGDKTDEKKEDGDKPEEKKDEEAGGGDAKPSQETEEKAAEEEKPSEEQKEDEAEEEKKEE
ncbi:putative retinol dehydrogenase 12-like [Apostichopus japonicus]|uniref:Putative retinol dehydrogenase 12-like n=1 Tax=Stichopus japonicus TaxID=307972 RepID=A0A2G8L4Y7_STIJA|nr:putative retinol dehydrogenase 12-like [Apostichopus japonicus]